MFYNARYFLIGIALLLAGNSLLFLASLPSSQHADILIIAPHPDDAVFCCAGLIQQAISKKQSVHILELTNGEAYASAAAYLSNKSVGSVTSADYLQLGVARKKEEHRATRILGLRPRHITFLGYPDGLLEEVYNTRDNTPFPSRYTGLSAAIETGNPFTGAAVTHDIAAAITRTQPAIIVAPDMTDTALDHTIARRFVDDAIKSVAYRGQLLTYVIHTDTTPPYASDTPSLRIHLSAREKYRKQHAIAAYRTQHALEPEYVSSFIGDEEIFAQFTQP